MKIEFNNKQEFTEELQAFLLENTDYISTSTRVSTSLLEHIADETKTKLQNARLLSDALMGTCKLRRKNERDGTVGMIRYYVEKMYGRVPLSALSIAVQEFYNSIKHVTPQKNCEEQEVLIIDDTKQN